MKDILITGSTGFVGTNLIPYLKRKGNNVLGISRKIDHDTYTVIDYKSLDVTCLNRANAFVHLAGKAHDLKKTSNDEEYFIINRDLTIKMFDLFLESSCSVFIFVSSVKAVADSLNNPLTEDTLPNPQTPYGKSKLEAENYILSKKIPKGKKVYILRPCMIHGPGNKGNLNLLYTIVRKSVPSPFGYYNNKRSFVSIENFCFIIEHLLDQEPASNVFNISDDDSFSINELIQIIGISIDKKTYVLKVPKFIIQMVAYIGDVFSFIPLNSERLEKMTENYEVSNTKIQRVLNTTLPIKAEEGLKKTIKSFR